MSDEIVKNKKAFYNYEIVDEIEAGIVLYGHEVKSIRNRQVNITDAYVDIDSNQEAWLKGCDISKYKFADIPDYDPLRKRKLLLKSSEITMLTSKSKAGKMTIVPLRVYIARNRVKVSIGLAKGRKRHEKKQKLKEKQLEKDLHRDKRQFMVV